MKDTFERIWRCDCGGPHFLSIRRDKDFGNGLMVEADSICGPRWREKLKAAWAILRHGHYDAWIDVILDDKTAREVLGELAGLVGAQVMYTYVNSTTPVTSTLSTKDSE